MKYKVLITTSGIGERLGLLTKYLNKALIRVGKKPAISYIIEAYPIDVPLVITVGYRADQIKEFMELAYPERKVEYVAVDKYQGQGTSLGYSMLAAKNNLQCSFIFHACDTIVEGDIPEPLGNWIGGFKSQDTRQYASWRLGPDDSLIFSEKGAVKADWLHIGLSGISDYHKFWETLENLYETNPQNSALNDCHTIEAMLKGGSNFRMAEFPVWLDIGNPAALQNSRQRISDRFNNLDKPEEAIYFIKDSVVKFFFDPKTAKERLERARILKGLVPEVEKSTEHFYRYRFVEGKPYPAVASGADFNNFLAWCEEKLWRPVEAPPDFKQICLKFYRDKTKERAEKFLSQQNLKDEPQIINQIDVPALSKIFSAIDWDWLADSEPSGFHGDLVLDNVIKTRGGYCLVDWRQNFGGLLTAGDKYYDLGKIYHNLTVNHDIIGDGRFAAEINGAHVSCGINRLPKLLECETALINYAKEKKLDFKKISVIRSLIWLSMSALHPEPKRFNEFLFYFGKLNLWQALNQ